MPRSLSSSGAQLKHLPRATAGSSRQLRAMTGRELQRIQHHILLLIRSAKERVVGFLLEMAARVKSNDEIELPMSTAGYRRLSRANDRNIFPHAEGP